PVAVDGGEGGARPDRDSPEHLGGRHPLESVVEPGPRRHAVDIAAHRDFGEAIELLPRPAPRGLDLPGHRELPRREVDPRDRPIMEHRPFLRPGLPRGKTRWLRLLHQAPLYR